ncbi:S8 family serine peptidase [Stutzerimonas stutzeri]|uniref:S8 family serine peptidase n=1 Tax=Stutzerimonas stutzeri TaxID=316 RepID=UPI003013818E
MGNTLFKAISGTSLATPCITHLTGRLLNEYRIASGNLLRSMQVNHVYLPDEVTTPFFLRIQKGLQRGQSYLQT